MAFQANLDRTAFCTDTSASFQSDIAGLVGRLESLLSQRDQQVAQAMADFQADGVSEQYQHVEKRWQSASHEVRNIINLVKQTMSENDQTAGQTQARARTAVENIG